MSSTHKITYSTELMDNYLEAEVVSPQKKFNALQTADGHALLFAISTSGHFYLFAQTPGHATGWKRYDLGKKLFKQFKGKKIKTRTFAVAENKYTGKIDMALALTVDGHDHLYLSLGNDNAMGAMKAKHVKWEEMTYDDPDHAGIKLHITELYISESSREEYIVADVSRSTFKKPSDFINRYHIDPSKSAGRVWNNMVVGGDVEPDIHSTLGRMQDERVDGTYNLGKINGKTELMYAPLYNPFSRSAPPTVTTFKVPKGATALDTAYVDKHTTALFVAGHQALYYYAADKQKQNASGKLVLKSDFFVDVTKLFAYATADTFIVWGINRANQIFYTTCPISKATDSSAWTFPLPLLSGVDQVSPYVNKADDGNVFFAMAGDELFKMVQSPETTIWKKSHVRLKTPKAKTEKVKSFTTRIQLADDQGHPVANEELYLSTPSRTAFYINHLYYVLDKTPIPVKTDAVGSLTMMEIVHDVHGAKINVSEKEGKAITIDPSEKPFQKAISLDSKEKLKNAQIEKPDGSKQPLVTDHSKLDQLVQANAALAKAHKKVSGTDEDTTAKKTETKQDPKSEKAVALVKAGDLFGFLSTNEGHTLTVHHDPLTSVWKAVVSVGEWVYHAVLDTLDSIYSALKWVYHAIGLDKLIEFLSYLFAWKDIARTKKVMKNLVKSYLQHEVDQFGEYKKVLDSQFNKLLDLLDNWAGITDDMRLGEAGTSSPKSNSNPTQHNSAPGSMLMHHYVHNGKKTKEVSKSKSADISAGPFTGIINALKNEGAIVEDALNEVMELAKEYEDMSTLDMVKRLVGIMGGVVIKSAQNVIDALLNLMQELSQLILDILDTEIKIPVISDILEEFGVSSPSFLDIFCWIAAVPATIIYKAAYHKAPFPDNEYTDFLIHTSDYKEIKKAFNDHIPGSGLENISSVHTDSPLSSITSSTNIVSLNTTARTIVARADSGSSTYTKGPVKMPEAVARSIYVTGYSLAGFCCFFSTLIGTAESLEEQQDNVWGKPAAVLGILGSASSALASGFVPRDPIKNDVVKWTHEVTVSLIVMNKALFCGPVQKRIKPTGKILGKFKVDDGRKIGSAITSILSIPSLLCSTWHFMELGIEDKASTDKTAAILDETANVIWDINHVAYMVAVNDEEPLTKAIAAGIYGGSYLINSGLYTTVALLDGV